MDNNYQIVIEAVDKASTILKDIKKSVSDTSKASSTLNETLEKSTAILKKETQGIMQLQAHFGQELSNNLTKMNSSFVQSFSQVAQLIRENTETSSVGFSDLSSKLDILNNTLSKTANEYQDITNSAVIFKQENEDLDRTISEYTEHLWALDSAQNSVKDETVDFTNKTNELKEAITKSSTIYENTHTKLGTLNESLARNNGLLLSSFQTFRQSADTIKESTESVASSIAQTTENISSLSNITAINIEAQAQNTKATLESAKAYRKFDTDIVNVSKRLDNFGDSIEGYSRRIGTQNLLTAELNNKFRDLKKPLEDVANSFGILNKFLKDNIVTQEEYIKSSEKLKSRIEKLEESNLKLKDKLNKQKDEYKSYYDKVIELRERFIKKFADQENKFGKSIEKINKDIEKNSIKYEKQIETINKRLNKLEQKYSDVIKKQIEHKKTIKELVSEKEKLVKTVVDVSKAQDNLGSSTENTTNKINSQINAIRGSASAFSVLFNNVQAQTLAPKTLPLNPALYLKGTSYTTTPNVFRELLEKQYSYIGKEVPKPKIIKQPSIFDRGWQSVLNFRKNAPEYVKNIRAIEREVDRFGFTLKGVYFTLGSINRFINLTRFLGQRFSAISEGLHEPYMKTLEAQRRLMATTSLVKGNTEENTRALISEAEAMSKVTYLTKEQIMLAQSQLATFRLNNQSLKDVTNSIVNMAVGIYGTQVSEENIINTANMVGKAFQGQFGQLQRNGILVSKQQKEMMKTAKETEKVVIFNQIIAENFGKEFAKIMAKTPYGQIEMMKQQFQETTKVMGQKLLPYTMAIKYQWYSFVTSPAFSRFLEFVVYLGQKLASLANKTIAFLDILVIKLFGTEEAMRKAKETAKFLFGTAIVGGAFMAGTAIASMLLKITATITALAALNPIAAGVFATIGLLTTVAGLLMGNYLKSITETSEAFNGMGSSAEVNLKKVITTTDITIYKMKKSFSDFGTSMRTIFTGLANALLVILWAPARAIDLLISKITNTKSTMMSWADWQEKFAKDDERTLKKDREKLEIEYARIESKPYIGQTLDDYGVTPYQAFKEKAKTMSYDELIKWKLGQEYKSVSAGFNINEFDKLVKDFESTIPPIGTGEGLALDDLLNSDGIPVKVKNTVDFRNDKFDEFLKRQVAREAKASQTIVNNINISSNVNREDADFLTGILIENLVETLNNPNTTKGLNVY